MIPRKFGQLVFGFLLSGLMSLVVSGISTFRAVGWVPDFLGLWSAAWFTAWLVAFPIVVIAAPLVGRLANRLLETGAGKTQP